jgi:hypothetical protein
MTSRQWRERLTFLVVSAFLVWHTLAVVFAPAPNASLLIGSVREVLQPYLTLFRLDNPWGFFAPTVGNGDVLRYAVEDPSGEFHAYAPADDLSWFHPSWFWFRSWHYAIIDNPEFHADAAAAFFCRKHLGLHPVSVVLLDYQERAFTRDDFLRGKRPTDPEFFVVHTVKRVKCPAS